MIEVNGVDHNDLLEITCSEYSDLSQRIYSFLQDLRKYARLISAMDGTNKSVSISQKIQSGQIHPKELNKIKVKKEYIERETKLLTILFEDLHVSGENCEIPVVRKVSNRNPFPKEHRIKQPSKSVV
jgi:hypothetical protein